MRTYKSRYSGQCACCGKKYEKGDEIALLPEETRALWYRIGLCQTRVYKYAHVACLPEVPAAGTAVEALYPIASRMLALTDPNWPKDHIGLSAADASPVKTWLHGDDAVRHVLTIRVVRRFLATYKNTQLSAGEVESLESIKSQPYLADNARKTTDNESPNATNKESSSSRETTELFGGTVFVDQASTGDVLIDKNGGDDLFVRLLPPWEAPAHAAIKDAIKRAGARWAPEKKIWITSPAAVLAAADLLSNVSVTVTEAALGALKAARDRKELANAASVTTEEAGNIRERLHHVMPKGLALYPYQEAGVAFCVAAQGNALVGDEMGLGKTPTSLAYLALEKQYPALIVVPAVVASNWQREAKKWIPGAKVQRIQKGKDSLDTADIVIVTYNLVTRHEEIRKHKWAIVVCDESHYLKNYKAKRTQAVLDIVKKAGAKCLCLSGTPLVNRPVEFFTTLKLLRPVDFRSWNYYTKKYCNGHETRWGYDASGASNLDELGTRLRDVMVRRIKEQVLNELPAKQYDTIDVETPVSFRKEYKGILKSIDPNKPGAALTELVKARELVGRAKAGAAIQWIEYHTEQNQPLLVFAHHQSVLHAIKEACEAKSIPCAVIDGATSQDQRGKLVDSFQAGGLNVLIISIKAGGVGITLTRAQNVLFVERAWTPGDEQQAEDRAHRIGQEGSVLVRRLIADMAIDGMMNELLIEKAKVISAALDGEGALPENLSIQKELLAKWIASAK